MAYMAPEQIQGKPRPASDQYSLGIVVYEWLGGYRPFYGSLAELVGQHLSVPPPPLQEKISTISPEVDQVVLTALAKDPRQRFANIQIFATTLEQAIQSMLLHPPAATSVTSPLSQSPKPSVGTPSARRPSVPTNIIEGTLPEPSNLGANVVIPPQSQSSQITYLVTPPSQSLQPTFAARPIHARAVSPPSIKESIPSGEPQPSKHRISRRVVVTGMAGLAGMSAVGGGIAWLAHLQKSQLPSNSLRPTPTTTSKATPAATATPTPAATATATHISTWTSLYTYRGHHNAVRAVAWSPDGKRVASGSDDNTVQVWDALTGGNILTYHGHVNGVNTVAWSPNGRHIASGGEGGNLQVWNATTGVLVLTYRGLGDIYNMNTAVWSPDSRYIALSASPVTTGFPPNVVHVWDTATDNTALIYHGHSNFVWALSWSPNGRRVASGGGPGAIFHQSIDNSVQVWDALTGGNTLTYHGHSMDVLSLTWSPDSKRLASASSDNTVHVWNASSGANVFTYRGHIDAVLSVSWSFDGTKIASGGNDRTVQVWDATIGNTILTYPRHSSYIYSVAWSFDSKRIASASDDRTVQIWEVS